MTTIPGTTGQPTYRIIRVLLDDETQRTAPLLFQAMMIPSGTKEGRVGVEWILSDPARFVDTLLAAALNPVNFLESTASIRGCYALGKLLGEQAMYNALDDADRQRFVITMLTPSFDPPDSEWITVARVAGVTLGNVVHRALLEAVSEFSKNVRCDIEPVMPKLVADWMRDGGYWSVLDKEQFIEVVRAVGRAWPWWLFKADQDGGGANYDRVLNFLRQFDDGGAAVWGPLCLEEAAVCLKDLDGVDQAVFAQLYSTTIRSLVLTCPLSLPHLAQVLADLTKEGEERSALHFIELMKYVVRDCELDKQFPTWTALRNSLNLSDALLQRLDSLFWEALERKGWRVDVVVPCPGRVRCFFLRRLRRVTVCDDTFEVGDMIMCRGHEEVLVHRPTPEEAGA